MQPPVPSKAPPSVARAAPVSGPPGGAARCAAASPVPPRPPVPAKAPPACLLGGAEGGTSGQRGGAPPKGKAPSGPAGRAASPTSSQRGVDPLASPATP
eukprot:12027582-Alexandrium_andersonii.AAC.1